MMNAVCCWQTQIGDCFHKHSAIYEIDNPLLMFARFNDDFRNTGDADLSQNDFQHEKILKVEGDIF